ncbi:hypothetical protein tinsulaeT_01050 [Thalassotalea insulae]|uniref:Photosynthesis system II assembly factor Ycf48/Hcf136-like domain-containing protein n=1 Tax=Thalassotalea insulae TaxID=2056778 RepID=A0ABQ6GQQ0_9GAMM|nr:YCF48-related protein [Thalassotalea insulae]GLX76765.1 hypothetical protein tinsulaeT_01050 [Thalassotalea insulae]
MRILIGLVCAICCFSTVSAQQLPQAAIQSELAVRSMLFDIVKVDNSFMVAVGERGHILRASSVDSWQQVDVPSQTTLTAVTFVDAQTGWAVGHDATILATQDGGFSWQVQQFLPSTQKPLLDVAFKDSKEGVAVGAYGLFYRTIDGGRSWQQEFHTSLLAEEDLQYLEELRQEDEQVYLDELTSILPHFNRVVIDGRTLYLIGELGLIAKSNDFGRSWQRFEEIYQGSFFDLARTQHGNLLAIGLRGNIYRSLTNGEQWQKSESGVTTLLNTIVLAGEAQVFLLGNNGVLLESVDDGVTFDKRIQNDGKALLAGVTFNGDLVVASEVGIKVLKVVK